MNRPNNKQFKKNDKSYYSGLHLSLSCDHRHCTITKQGKKVETKWILDKINKLA